jgi:hypothetical protein
MPTRQPEQQLTQFIAKFTPEMGKLIRTARAKMRSLMPQALELVYDNYNFFVIGYGPTEKAGDAIFSLAAQAKGLSLCFLQGARRRTRTNYCEATVMWCATFASSPPMDLMTPMFVS